MYHSVASLLGVAAQIGLVGSTLAVASLSPPAQGEILLIPLTAGAARQVAKLAIDRDARLVARGALSGSLVVEGNRARLAGAMLAAGIVPIASDSPLCGALAGAGRDG